jgi:hypothetical protein
VLHLMNAELTCPDVLRCVLMPFTSITHQFSDSPHLPWAKKCGRNSPVSPIFGIPGLSAKREQSLFQRRQSLDFTSERASELGGRQLWLSRVQPSIGKPS